MDTWNWFFAIAISVFVLVGAVCDWRSKKLPNWLTVSGFVAGLLYHALHGAIENGWWGLGSELLSALAGFAVGFGLLLVMWLFGWGGAGDVKLMGALGAWLGVERILTLFFVSTVFVLVGSVLVLAWSMISRGMERTRRQYLKPGEAKAGGGLSRAEAAQALKVRRRLMPYGVPVAFATWTVLAWWFTHVPR